MPTPPPTLIKHINRHYSTHIRFRLINARPANTHIVLTGAVLEKKHKHQAVEVASTYWNMVLDHISVWFALLIVIHLIIDVVVIRLAILLHHWVPPGHAPSTIVHECCVILLFVALMTHLAMLLVKNLR